MDKNKLSISPDEFIELFEKAMTKLAMSVDKEMGEERSLIYFEQLRKYKIEEIQAAVNQAIHDNEFNLIPTVGKLIRYIEDNREERREKWPRLEHLEKWPEISDERLKELLQTIYKELEGKGQVLSGEEREKKWKENKERLQKQISLVKQNAGRAEPK